MSYTVPADRVAPEKLEHRPACRISSIGDGYTVIVMKNQISRQDAASIDFAFYPSINKFEAIHGDLFSAFTESKDGDSLVRVPFIAVQEMLTGIVHDAVDFHDAEASIEVISGSQVEISVGFPVNGSESYFLASFDLSAGIKAFIDDALAAEVDLETCADELAFLAKELEWHAARARHAAAIVARKDT